MTRREIVTELAEILRDLAQDGLDMWDKIQAAVAQIQALKDKIEAEGEPEAYRPPNFCGFCGLWQRNNGIRPNKWRRR